MRDDGLENDRFERFGEQFIAQAKNDDVETVDENDEKCGYDVDEEEKLGIFVVPEVEQTS